MDLCGLQRFFEGKWRQDGRDTLGEHGLARTGWADHQNIVSPCAGDFEGPLCGLLAAHILEADAQVDLVSESIFRPGANGLGTIRRIDQLHNIQQSAYREDVNS